MIHEHEGKLYVDTAFLNAIQAKMSDSTMIHTGFGDFTLETPKGKVKFDRERGVPFKGCNGRTHLAYGDAEAIRLMIGCAEGC